MSESVSIIIPTYCREKDLEECIISIAHQTVRPLEVIVVDDGELPAVPGAQQLEKAGIPCVYRRKNGNRGIAASRHVGNALARGDFVLHLDDDVELEPDHIDQLLGVFRDDPEGRIGGASGFDLNEAEVSHTNRLLAWLSLPLMIGGSRPGRVLPSGFCTTMNFSGAHYRKPLDCDVLPGCNMMFRRNVVARLSCTVEYEGYGAGEDQDLTYRISRTHRLVWTPAARYIHKEDSTGRPNPRLRGQQKVLHQYRFYKYHVRRSAWQDPVFAYALFNHILIRTLVALAAPSQKNRQRVRGLLDGVGMILRRKG